MANSQYQDVNPRAPYGDGTAVTSVRLFTCDSTSRAHAVPAAWAGKMVLIINETGNLAQFFFSKSGSAQCDETIAAADAGASNAQLGGSILGNSGIKVKLPSISVADGESLYFVRASVTSTSLRMSLASD